VLDPAADAYPGGRFDPFGASEGLDRGHPQRRVAGDGERLGLHVRQRPERRVPVVDPIQLVLPEHLAADQVSFAPAEIAEPLSGGDPFARLRRTAA
jgi:hypothetical protein